VQGFGSSDKPARAPGFDVPLEAPGGNLQDRYDKQVLDKTDKEVLPRFDTDKDGFISGEESEASDWDPPFADSDLDKDGRLSQFELYERYAKKLNLPAKGAVVSSAAGGGAKPVASAAGGGDGQDRVAGYAKGFLVRYDKDKSGVLEKDKDEWKDLKPDFQAADANKDNVITQEELVVKFASFAAGGAGGSPAGSATPSSAGSRGGGRWGGREGSGRSGEKGTADGRKSYRVPTATERLPKGLPDWFARNDTDADGQVMMAEYLTELTDAKAAEFARYDLNGDGIITPDECLESAKGSGGSGGPRR
jgi:Ca2+-binding EF-hand superfamily protein